MAEVRTLLRFSGRCDGCDLVIDLTGEEARDQLFVHTVDPQMRSVSLSLGYPDWPAVVCRECRDRMADEGHATFVDYKFSLNPSCPQMPWASCERDFLRDAVGLPQHSALGAGRWVL